MLYTVHIPHQLCKTAISMLKSTIYTHMAIVTWSSSKLYPDIYCSSGVHYNYKTVRTRGHALQHPASRYTKCQKDRLQKKEAVTVSRNEQLPSLRHPRHRTIQKTPDGSSTKARRSEKGKLSGREAVQQAPADVHGKENTDINAIQPQYKARQRT